MNRIAENIPSEDENSETDEQFKLLLSFGTDTINHILAAANCPHGFRAYIDYLVGIASGSPEFEAADADVVSRVRLSEKETTPNADKLWLKRLRNELDAWQQRSGVLLVECRRGYMESVLDHSGGKRKVFHSTRYYLHILNLAARVIAEARKAGQFWAANPLFAIKRAAQKEVRGLSGRPRPAFVLASRPDVPWYVGTRRDIQAAHTFMFRAVQSIPQGGALTGKNSELVDEIEELLEKLKKKKG